MGEITLNHVVQGEYVALLDGVLLQDFDVMSNLSGPFQTFADAGYYKIGMVPPGTNTSDAVNLGQLNGAVSSLNTNLSSLQTQVNGTSSTVTTHTSQIGSMSSSLTTATGNISTMQGQMTSAQGNITTLQGQMTTAQGNITTLQASVTSLQDAVEYVGDMKMSARTADHGKWLLCDGRAVSRTTYASLFAVLGSAFGAGDGSTTFNLPNPKGRSPLAVGQGSTIETGGGTNRVLGATGGSESHILTVAEMPSHSHTFTNQTIANDASLSLLGTGNRVTASPTTNTSSVGGSTAHSLMHPWIAMGNYFVYTG